MSQETLEARVARLEDHVAGLVRERNRNHRPSRDAWEATVGMFRSDPIFGEMIQVAEQLREEDRRKTRDGAELGSE